MSASSASNWPPAVRDWVTKCLSQMTDSNRDAAQAELKAKISEAFHLNTLWSTDWSTIELESLKPPPKPQLKRKADESVSILQTTRLALTSEACSSTALTKKLKKSSIAEAPYEMGASMLEQRNALRFQREHDIERQRSAGKEPYRPPAPAWETSRHVNSSLTNPSSRYSNKHKSRGGDEEVFENENDVIDWDKYTIVGRSQELFKKYLRITSAPNPSTIRPLPVLKETLRELSRRWRENPDYVWTCDQFKSLRQDLTVQRIKNDFTVMVYEIHARMALESEDLVEYNQCQAMLRHLYDLDLPGHREEFMAYRILYLCFTRSRSDLNILMSTLTPEQKQHKFIRQALDIQTALSTNNYHAFFKLFQEAYNMGGYILDHLLERERVAALVIMTKSYKQLPISFITTELAFDSAPHTTSFLQQVNGASYLASSAAQPDELKVLDCKPAHAPLTEWQVTKYAKVGIKIKGAI